MTAPIYPPMPEHSLVVLIGPSGTGKNTLANTWPASQVLSLDALREVVSNDAGTQDATGDAVAALHLLLEARMRRRLFTVIDSTSLMIGRVQASGEASVARVVHGVGARSGAVGIAAD
ncbi:AAA family ATPase (plasmid) [Streptomyces sp. WC2508]|uniref:AAA family ATPase n=1 Tax=Streptomyces sp. WC2508 TaxID=3461405 RepID=UPI004043F3C4